MGQLSLKFEVCHNFHKPKSKKPPQSTLPNIERWHIDRKKLVWVTSHLISTPIILMSDIHIQRAISKLSHLHPKQIWAGYTRKRWIKFFKKELYYRKQNVITQI